MAESAAWLFRPMKLRLQQVTLTRDGEEPVMRTVNMPRAISLENVGNGFRVSLVERDNGWERVVRSGWYPDLPLARARAKEWSVENADCCVREIGTARKPG
jgi:hypothetical protein